MPQTQVSYPFDEKLMLRNSIPNGKLIDNPEDSPVSNDRSSNSSFCSSENSKNGDYDFNGDIGSEADRSFRESNSHNNSSRHFHNDVPSISLSSNGAEENFECIAEGTESSIFPSDEHASLPYNRDSNETTPIKRSTWLRSSLRNRSPSQAGPTGTRDNFRRWGSVRNPSGTRRLPPTSNALANQLYRTSSFHSSGRSSAGEVEEMYSDASLEEDVNDLRQTVHHLEEKFSVFAEKQSSAEENDRYVKLKQENTELATKLFMAEELLRDTEQRSSEALKGEKKRTKELLARAETEHLLKSENYEIRLQSTEKEFEQMRLENDRLKQKLDRERSEKLALMDKLENFERDTLKVREIDRAAMEVLKKERDSYVVEATAAQQSLMELKKEFENSRRLSHSHDHRSNRFHSDSVEAESELAELKSRLAESEDENRRLKKQVRQLQEINDELNAQLRAGLLNQGLEEGRNLLSSVNRAFMASENSLAAEFAEMTAEQQLKKALKEQTEANEQLRSYIDGILLNIVENYPQLLEIKNKDQIDDCSITSGQ